MVAVCSYLVTSYLLVAALAAVVLTIQMVATNRKWFVCRLPTPLKQLQLLCVSGFVSMAVASVWLPFLFSVFLHRKRRSG